MWQKSNHDMFEYSDAVEGELFGSTNFRTNAFIFRAGRHSGCPSTMSYLENPSMR